MWTKVIDIERDPSARYENELLRIQPNGG